MSTPRPTEAIEPVAEILVRALRRLGDEGFPDAASRFAAKAWWLMRDDHPRQAAQLNGLLHYLARLPAELGAPATETPMNRSHDDKRSEA